MSTVTEASARERMQRAKDASRAVALLDDEAKSHALRTIADAIEAASAEIVAANAEGHAADAARLSKKFAGWMKGVG